jgi:hypothetical protein
MLMQEISQYLYAYGKIGLNAIKSTPKLPTPNEEGLSLLETLTETIYSAIGKHKVLVGL